MTEAQLAVMRRNVCKLDNIDAAAFDKMVEIFFDDASEHDGTCDDCGREGRVVFSRHAAGYDSSGDPVAVELWTCVSRCQEPGPKPLESALFTGATFGETIAAARKSRILSRHQLLAKSPELNVLLDEHALNELEQDRSDPRKHPQAERLIRALAKALNIREEYLQILSEDFERASAQQRQRQREYEFAANVYHAKYDRG
jgi:transcriptional regulator with XRE-family HTH domain